MITQLYTTLVKRRSEMESAVFLYPPRDWSELQRRMGAWHEVDGLVTELEKLIKGEEES